MGSIVISGSTSGTVTVSAPAEAGTRTITLPAATGTAILEDGSNNLQMNSGFGSSATAYGCRAWVNFNGTGTVAIRDSGNVSSITDRGAGIYTVNFATNMPDVNYCGATSAIDDITADNQRNRVANAYSSSVSASYVNSFTTDSAADDVQQINVIYVR